MMACSPFIVLFTASLRMSLARNRGHMNMPCVWVVEYGGETVIYTRTPRDFAALHAMGCLSIVSRVLLLGKPPFETSTTYLCADD